MRSPTRRWEYQNPRPGGETCMYMYKSDFSSASACRKLFAARLLTQFFFRDLHQARRYITLRVSCSADAWGVRTLVLKRKNWLYFRGLGFRSKKANKTPGNLDKNLYGDCSAGHFLFTGAAVQRSPQHSIPVILSHCCCAGEESAAPCDAGEETAAPCDP